MPKVRAGNITMNYDQEGSGEALVLIPHLAAEIHPMRTCATQGGRYHVAFAPRRR